VGAIDHGDHGDHCLQPPASTLLQKRNLSHFSTRKKAGVVVSS
jgi:hypothetical protein